MTPCSIHRFWTEPIDLPSHAFIVIGLRSIPIKALPAYLNAKLNYFIAGGNICRNCLGKCIITFVPSTRLPACPLNDYVLFSTEYTEYGVHGVQWTSHRGAYARHIITYVNKGVWYNWYSSASIDSSRTYHQDLITFSGICTTTPDYLSLAKILIKIIGSRYAHAEIRA